MFVGMHITSLQENEVKAGLNLKKESVDSWTEGTLQYCLQNQQD